MIVGVDRLDYSKGLDERLLGFELFLKDNADFHGKVFLLQIAPPSRDDVDTYQDIRNRARHPVRPHQRRLSPTSTGRRSAT